MPGASTSRRRLRLAFVVLVIIIFGLLAGLRAAGIPLRGVDDALPVAVGLAAKLACSGEYVSGFDDAQVKRDIQAYSPILSLVELQHPEPSLVRATLLGAEAAARYYPGIGCTLQRAGMAELQQVRVADTPVVDAPWPHGDSVPPPRPGLQKALESMLAADNRDGLDTRALLVVQGGEVAAEAYAPGIDASTPLLGWSMGKSVTALITGRMQALGLLSLQEANLFPDWSQDGRRAITLAQMLHMSSGLAFSEDYIPGNDSTRMLFTASSASAVPLAKPLAFAPGEHFAYSSGTTNLICRLIAERIGGGVQGQVDFFHREIAAPLGLKHTVMEFDPSGIFVGSSYVYASARDWARLALPLLDDGRVDGRRWLPEGWVDSATTPNPSANEPRYGYQFWLNGRGDKRYWPSLPDDTFAMSGHSGQSVMILPSVDAVFVRLGWTSGAYPVDDRVGKLLPRLRGAMPD